MIAVLQSDLHAARASEERIKRYAGLSKQLVCCQCTLIPNFHHELFCWQSLRIFGRVLELDYILPDRLRSLFLVRRPMLFQMVKVELEVWIRR